MIRSLSKLLPFFGNGSVSPVPRDWTASDLSESLGYMGHQTLDEVRGEPSLEERLETVFREGFERGKEVGVSQTVEELNDAISSLRGAAGALHEEVARRTNATEDNLRALAIAVARHLLDRELETDAEEISRLVSRALAKFPLDEAVRIRLNPIDLNMISATVAAQGEGVHLTEGREVEWIPDQSISRGGFLVEGQERLLDAQLDRALERVYRELSDA